MPFLNGSNSTINNIVGSGPASNTTDFVNRVRAFLAANGWTATTLTAPSNGISNVIFSSLGLNGDENINIRMQEGAVQNSLAPLATPTQANYVRFTASPFFDAGGQVVYNEVGMNGPACEVPVDDNNPFNFWVFTDSNPSTHVHVVTQKSGQYNHIFAGRLSRQVYNQTAKVASAINASSPGSPQQITVSLDRPRPTSWYQGKVLFIQSQNVSDNSNNGSGIGTLVLPIERCVVGDLTSAGTNQVVLTVSRNYNAGAIIGQDPLPIGVVQNPIGVGEQMAMSYGNGGGLNQQCYTAPNNQPFSVGVPALSAAGADITQVLADEGPDQFGGDNAIIALYTFNNSALCAFRHQLPNFGRVPPTSINPLDELLLPSGDRWLAFTINSARIAIGKEN